MRLEQNISRYIMEGLTRRAIDGIRDNLKALESGTRERRHYLNLFNSGLTLDLDLAKLKLLRGAMAILERSVKKDRHSGKNSNGQSHTQRGGKV